MQRVAAFLVSLVAVATAFAATTPAGTVTGLIVDSRTNRPVSLAVVTLEEDATPAARQDAVTDDRGRFLFEAVPPGSYRAVYRHGSSPSQKSGTFTVTAAPRAHDLGRLPLAPVLTMDPVEVSARQAAFLNTIDRKVYNVSRDVQSATGTASDLLQKLPSVDVDLDGNVSLRGSDDVMILMNGRTSAMMGRSRADLLQQLPADSIERIEVITNPSAKYKPDGTAGIINIVLKSSHDAGFSSTVSVNAGNQRRAQASVSAAYNPGRYSLSGNLSLRQDDRLRHSVEERTLNDPAGGADTHVSRSREDEYRPVTRIARAGLDFDLDERNRFGATVTYLDRSQVRRARDRNLVRAGETGILTAHTRSRRGAESEAEPEITLSYDHRFPRQGHELKFEFKASEGTEEETNHDEDDYRAIARRLRFETMRTMQTDRESEFIIDYAFPVSSRSTLEAGYTRSAEREGSDVHAEVRESADAPWSVDAAKSHRFQHDSVIDAFYVTYGRTLGKFGLLAGLRPELTSVESHLGGAAAPAPNRYSRIYPSLHLSWRPADAHEFQVNYSHRVNRPDSEELNPFIEYDDPLHLRAGNPHLVPEDVHSIEAGYGFHHERMNLTATVYHRHRYNGFSSITRDLGEGVLLTTEENLADNRSTGFEMTADAELGGLVSVDLSTNTFFNTIDASNLGYSSRESSVSWTARMGASFHLPRRTLMQLHAHYASSRLTPQGTRGAAYYANLGVRHEFRDKRAAVTVTISDLFNSLRETTRLDTPGLRSETVRRRNGRAVFVGLTFYFGKPPKKQDGLAFDEEP